MNTIDKEELSCRNTGDS
jgi:hypothetical protein